MFSDMINSSNRGYNHDVYHPLTSSKYVNIDTSDGYRCDGEPLSTAACEMGDMQRINKRLEGYIWGHIMLEFEMNGCSVESFDGY